MPEYLDFLNKNVYRNYPFQGISSLVSDSSAMLSDNVIADASLTTTSAYPRVYAQQVYVGNNYVSIALGDFATGTNLGVAQGAITSDFQNLPVVAAAGIQFGGSVTTGFMSNLSAEKGTFVFSNPASSELEQSVVAIVSTPGVISITAENVTAYGNIPLGKLVNVGTSTSGTTLFLSSISTNGLASVNDFDSSFRNCPTPVITSINGAVPYSANSGYSGYGNIFLIGISPIVFGPSIPTGGITTNTIDLTMTSLCTAAGAVLPPIDPTYVVDRPLETPPFVGALRYFTKSQTPVVDMFSAPEAEFQSWPQFTQTVTVSFNSVGSGINNKVKITRTLR